MNPSFIFLPSRRSGLLFHAAVTTFLLGSSALCVLYALNGPAIPYTLLLLLASVLFFAPVPVMVYRAYALLRASYTLERDGLHLRWGMRSEDIPLSDVEWVRPAVNLPVRLPLPRPSWPGALMGSVETDELGRVEFLASSRADLLLVATPGRVFAISPRNPQEFMEAFQEAFEMGSLSPIPASSILPGVYIEQVWSNPFARLMLIIGLVLVLLLLVGISLAIPGRVSTPLGFYPNGQPLPAVPAIQMLLLPILAALFYVFDLGAGLFFFRHPRRRPVAYLLWASSFLTTLLLALASLMILL